MKCHELCLPFSAKSPVTSTYFKGINSTFIAGILLTHISRLCCIYSSQTPARCLGAKAALSLGGPGTEEHKELRKEDCLDCNRSAAATTSGLARPPTESQWWTKVLPYAPQKIKSFAVRKQKDCFLFQNQGAAPNMIFFLMFIFKATIRTLRMCMRRITFPMRFPMYRERWHERVFK